MANVYFSPQNGWVLLKLSELISRPDACVGAWTNGATGCRVLGLLNSLTHRFAFIHHSPVLTTLSEEKLTQLNPMLAQAWRERHGTVRVFRRGFLDPENEWGAFRHIGRIAEWVLNGAPRGSAKLMLFMTAQNSAEATEDVKCLEYMRQLMRERAFVELHYLPLEATFSADAALVMQRAGYLRLLMSYYHPNHTGDNFYIDTLDTKRYPLFFVGQNQALFGPEFSAYLHTAEGSGRSIEPYEDYELAHKRIPMLDVIGDGAGLLAYDSKILQQNLTEDPEIFTIIDRLRTNEDLRTQFFSMPYVACVKSDDKQPVIYRSARSILLQRWHSFTHGRFLTD